jgi:hypothetical protein
VSFPLGGPAFQIINSVLIELMNESDIFHEESHLLGKVPVHPLLVTANVVPSSPITVTLIMEALSSSETSVLTRAT